MPVAGDGRAHGLHAGLERRRLVAGERAGGDVGPVLDEVALAGDEVVGGRGERQRRLRRDLLGREAVEPAPDVGGAAVEDAAGRRLQSSVPARARSPAAIACSMARPPSPARAYQSLARRWSSASHAGSVRRSSARSMPARSPW